MIVNIPPAIVRILNTARRIVNGLDEWEKFSACVVSGLENLKDQEAFFDQILPLLSQRSDYAELYRDVVDLAGGQKKLLQQGQIIGIYRDFQRLQSFMDSLGDNSQKFSRLLAKIMIAESSLEKLSPVRLLNDIMLLCTFASRGGGQSENLKKRFPNLLNYIMYMEQTLQEVRRFFPDETHLLTSLEESLAGLKQASGGIFLYLEDKKVEDLTPALYTLDCVGQGIISALNSLKKIDQQARHFSQDNMLEYVYRTFESYKEGQSTLNQFRASLYHLDFFLEREEEEFANLDNGIFMKPEIRSAYVPRIKKNISDLSRLFLQIKLNIASKDDIEVMLADFKNILLAQEDIRRELISKLNKKASLNGDNNFYRLLNYVVGAYEETIPDIYLEKQALYLDESQEDLRSRLLHEEGWDDKADDILERLYEIMDQHRIGFDMVYVYLKTGNRQILPQAYAVIEKATEDMQAQRDKLKSQGAPKQSKKVKGGVPCPRCFEFNEASRRICQRCGTPLPMSHINVKVSGRGIDYVDLDGVNSAWEEDENSYSDSFGFIEQVVEDTILGRLSFSESLQMLQPILKQINMVKTNMEESLPPIVARVRDSRLDESFRRFRDAMLNLQSAMRALLSAVSDGNPASMLHNLEPVMEAGNEIHDLNLEMESVLKKMV